VVLAPRQEIAAEDLPQEYRSPREAPAPRGLPPPPPPPPSGDLTMEEIERRAILAALDRTGGNRTQAAELLGIGLRTLQRKLKDYRTAPPGEDDG
jgi:DNA-binding NtrC family response regulator